MSNDLKVSIITVCFNAKETIEKTIQSVLHQEYPFIEYIVIDGKSTDRTMDVVNKYKITTVISEEDKGIYDAMNKGLRYASGDLICFLNADDLFFDMCVVSQIVDTFSRNESIDLVYGKLKFIDMPQEAWFSPTAYNQERKTKLDAIINSMPHQATFVRKNVFEKIGGFNLQYPIGADYDWFLRCFRMGIKMFFTSTYISFFSYKGASYQKRYIHIPERIKIVYRNTSAIEFLQYGVIAIINFIWKIIFEYIVWPIRKVFQV